MYKELAQQAVDGERNALQVFIELKQAEADLKYAMAVVQPLAIDEADKYAEKSFKAFGAIIEKRSSPSTWDYTQVAAFNAAKARLEYIQKIAQAGGGADSDTGEVIDKAIKISGKSTIAINLKTP